MRVRTAASSLFPPQPGARPELGLGTGGMMMEEGGGREDGEEAERKVNKGIRTHGHGARIQAWPV